MTTTAGVLGLLRQGRGQLAHTAGVSLASDHSTNAKWQRRFLPEELSPPRGLRIHAEYRPSMEVGGDFYDVVPAADGGAVALIGDVAGKGPQAAAVMRRIASLGRQLCYDAPSPSAVLEALNEWVFNLDRPETFVTATCLKLDPSCLHVTMANAGHVPPLVRKATGEVHIAEQRPGLPLGVDEYERYAEQGLELDDDDIIVLMTDGIPEALRLDMSRVAAVVANAPHNARAVTARLLGATADSPMPVDDIALLALWVRQRPYQAHQTHPQAHPHAAATTRT